MGVHGCGKKDVTGVTVASVTVSPASTALIVGESRSFTAVVRDEEGASLPGSLVTWASSDQEILSVSPEGLATGLQPGTAQVRATAQGVTGSATVTVQPGPVIAAAPVQVSLFAQRDGDPPEPVDIQITNGGGGTLTALAATLQYGAGEATGWLSLHFSSTRAPATLTLTGETNSLVVGTYHATVTLTSPVAGEDLQIGIELTVSEDRPILRLTPSAVGFAAVAGGPPPEQQTVQVLNAGGGDLTDLSTAVTYQSGSGWLTAALSSTSAPAGLSLSADPAALSPGTYRATVVVSSPVASNGPRSVTVSFSVDTEPEADVSVTKT
ncbi:MAG TPA: Ig-like domain-containing protein, partial [Longimicrobiales bacterium]|nr:Ig-like domain-containing protein [Longimicrobiales bacterium]